MGGITQNNIFGQQKVVHCAVCPGIWYIHHMPGSYKNNMNFNEWKNNLNHIFINLVITIIAGIVTNFLIVISVMMCGKNSLLISVISDCALFIALAIVPYVIYHKFFDLELNILVIQEKIYRWLICIFMGSILMLAYPVSGIGHFFIVALSEEILFRELQYTYFQKNTKYFVGLIASSIIFGIILHLNDSMFVNILLRIPLGMLLYSIRNRFGLPSSVYIHWVYDIVVSYW